MSQSSVNKSQSSIVEAFFFHIWKNSQKTLPLQSLNTKALRVLIVQSPRTINLFQLIKLLKPWNLFCFCILSVDWRSSKTEHHLLHRTQNGCPKGTGKLKQNKTKKQHTNKHIMTKQHSSSMYVGLLHLHLIPSVFSPPPALEVAALCDSKFSFISSLRDKVAT